MAYLFIKIAITAILIVAISEIAKRSSFLGAILASIPLISVLAMFWLYIDTKDVEKVSELSIGVFWLVLPSLALFIVLPLLLKQGVNFYLGMSVSIGITIGCYLAMVHLLKHYGVEL